MELTDTVKAYLREERDALRGVERRLFMARTVRLLGVNGQRQAERELGWNRVTIRKALRELERGTPVVDAFQQRGRQRVEDKLPNLLTDLRDLVEGSCQIDPTFQTPRLFCRLTAAAVRQQLHLQKGYPVAQLPSAETVRRKLHQLDIHLRAVSKSRPKKSPANRRHLH